MRISTVQKESYSFIRYPNAVNFSPPHPVSAHQKPSPRRCRHSWPVTSLLSAFGPGPGSHPVTLWAMNHLPSPSNTWHVSYQDSGHSLPWAIIGTLMIDRAVWKPDLSCVAWDSPPSGIIIDNPPRQKVDLIVITVRLTVIAIGKWKLVALSMRLYRGSGLVRSAQQKWCQFIARLSPESQTSTFDRIETNTLRPPASSWISNMDSRSDAFAKTCGQLTQR